MDLREHDADWLVFGFCGGFLPGFCLSFGFPFCLHGFGFAQQDFAQAGASFLADFFGVGGLFGRGDEGAVFVLVDLADDGRGVLQTHVSCASPSASLRAGSGDPAWRMFWEATCRP